MVEASGEREARAGDGTAPNTATALERAERAFAAGDHRTVQRVLAELPAAGDAAERARAEKLARAVNPDPAFIAVLVACGVALFGIFAHYVLWGGP